MNQSPYASKEKIFIGMFGKTLGSKLYRLLDPCCNTFCEDVNSCIDSNGVSRWVKVTKTYAELAAASTTNNISVYTLPAKGIILNARVIPSTTFSGGGITAYTVTVGVAGNVAIIHNMADVFTGGVGDLGIGISVTSIAYSMTATKDIRLYATSTDANLDQAVQGSVDIYLLVSVLPD